MLRSATVCGQHGGWLRVLSMLLISPRSFEIRVESVEAGEVVDSKSRQSTCGFGPNRMKNKRGRSSVG